MRATLGILALVLAVLSRPDLAFAGADDDFLRGYATALLRETLGPNAPPIRVTDGIIQVTAASEADRGRIAAALARVPGAVRVEFLSPAPTPGVAPTTPPPAVAAAPTTARASSTLPPPTPEGVPETIEVGFLPSGLIFDPLLADPRWPHFGASIQRYLDDPDFRNIASVSFGETIPLYRQPIPSFGGYWEVGIQAGVFAIFDMDSRSEERREGNACS